MDSTEKNCGGAGGGAGGGGGRVQGFILKCVWPLLQWFEMKPVVKDFVHARSAKGA